MKDLSLRQLRGLVAFADSGSVTAAADALGISQPAASMLLRQLEQELGVPLVERRGRGAGLSDAGRALLPHARAVLDELRRAEETLSRRAGGAAGQLHLGVVPTANYFAPRMLTEFARREPGVGFKLSVGRRDEILAMLKEHRLDIAIAGYPPGEAEVEAESFARHPHCIVASPAHPLAQARRIAWTTLRDEPFIFREAGSATRLFLEHLLQAQSLQVNVTLELAGNETVKQAVMAGMGISFMSAHAIQVELDAGRLVVLDVVGMPKWLDWCFLQRRNQALGGLNARFRQFVVERGAELAACRSL
ncbi:LysR family transcriptional regulator [Caldimonas tepidiphila]|uniref:LysR family transcriptional regulator n=1 Tax=Caldimonas tepidiphila TaxID=2315841 RepID=UPI000E5BB30F|nr:LysR family transcriptional regulator [Caldimonas tepidiphila]